MVLVLLMIGYSLFAKFQLTDSPDSYTVTDLKYGFLNGLVNTLLLFGALLVTPGFTLKSYGFTVRALPKQLLFGVLGFVASLLPVFILLVATNVFRSPDKLHPFLKMLQDHPSREMILWIGLAVTVSAPLMEELIYRVILQTTLSQWLPISIALPLAAVIFCAMHGWPDMVPLLPLALILGWIYHRHRSYLAIVTMHSLFNGSMLAWTVFGPKSV